jgi:hypothetical protein
MIKPANMLLAASLLTATLAMPVSANAHAEDNALAFVIGAAVGHTLDADRKHRRYSRAPHLAHVHRGHSSRFHPRWRARHHRWRHASKHKAHYRFDRRRDHYRDDHYRHDRDPRRGHRDRYERR